MEKRNFLLKVHGWDIQFLSIAQEQMRQMLFERYRFIFIAMKATNQQVDLHN